MVAEHPQVPSTEKQLAVHTGWLLAQADCHRTVQIVALELPLLMVEKTLNSEPVIAEPSLC